MPKSRIAFASLRKEWLATISNTPLIHTLPHQIRSYYYPALLTQAYRIFYESGTLHRLARKYSKRKNTQTATSLEETRGNNRKLIQLIRHDLNLLEIDADFISNQMPCPSVSAILDFTKSEIRQHGAPIYIYFYAHWKLLSIRYAQTVFNRLRTQQISEQNMKFLSEASRSDIRAFAHLQKMIGLQIQSNKDLRIASHYMKTLIQLTGYLASEAIYESTNPISKTSIPQKMPDWAFMTKEELLNELYEGEIFSLPMNDSLTEQTRTFGVAYSSRVLPYTAEGSDKSLPIPE